MIVFSELYNLKGAVSFSMEIKDQIKRSVSITDVVQSYGLDLKPAGKNYKALCPFHTEKTPSFFIKPESDSFACYGCNKFGDVFTFVQNMENIGFVEAMNLIIEKFNIPVEKKKGFNYSREKKYSVINDIALKYFSGNLSGSGEGNKAMEYLRARDISQKTINDFSLGYALNKWDGFLNFAKNKSLDLDMCIELGLLIKNSKGEVYDRFRGRIIFPIFSESGNVIGFGGRTISDDKIKYLNSPETPLFTKGKNLYGFNITKQFMREKKSSILVEGYFDVISLYQHGIKNVSASLGTALTPSQIHLLRRVSDEIFIAYDSDDAGIDATIRGIERMFEQNMNPNVFNLKGEKDPDDFIRKYGSEEFYETAGSSEDGLRFIINTLTKKYNTDIPEKKRDAVNQVAQYINKFDDPIVKEGYITIAADFFNVNEKELDFSKAIPARDSKSQKPVELLTSEKILLQSILKEPSFISMIEPLFNSRLYSVLNIGNLLKKIFSNYASENNMNYDLLQEELSPAENITLRIVFDSVDEISGDISILEKNIESSMINFFRLLNEVEISEIGKKIKRAERDGNIEEIKKLIIIKNKFNQQKYKVSLGGDIAKQ